MPRPRHAQGRPHTRVIPGDWNTTHAPVVDKASRGTCTLREPGTVQAWDPDIEQMVSAPHAPYYYGSCRVQALTGEARRTPVAEDPELVADYLVVVPLTVAAAESHIVTVTDATGDQVPLSLEVVHVVHGTERFERDLFCTLTR